MIGSLIFVVLVLGIQYASGFLAPSVTGGLEGRGDSEVCFGRGRCGLSKQRGSGSGCSVHKTARCGLEEGNMNECNGV